MAAKPGTALRAGAAVVSLPRRPRGPELLERLLPRGRPVAVALALALLGVGLYFVARESSLFAVSRVEIEGAPPQVEAAVRAAVRPFAGKSLVDLDGGALERTLDRLPVVASARYDRDFPHTLRIFVRPELAVAVVRRGSDSRLVSVRGRIMASLAPRTRLDLPRIWVPRSVSVAVGSTLGGDAADAVAALVPLRGTRFGRRVASARAGADELTLVLRSGLELRLGNERDLRLKLAVARRIVPRVPAGPGYVDLSVPGRPVSGTNLQVEG